MQKIIKQSSRYTSNRQTYDINNKDRTIIFVKLDSTIVMMEEEYYVYDFNAIISAVGGSLGLFLGCSFLSIITFIFEEAQLAISTWKSKNQKN